MADTARLTLTRPITALVAFAAAGLVAVSLMGGPAAFGLRAPDFGPIAAASLQIKVHLTAAVATFLLGAVLMLGAKGAMPHRTLGWTWAATMAVTAISSLFIRQVNHGDFSLIHALSGWTIIALPIGIYAARRHDIKRHRRTMSGIYVGGMFFAGGLAFLPGRILWAVFFA